MMQNFTQIQLVQYLYGESPKSQADKVETAIAADPLVAQEFDELNMAQSNLPKVKFNAPSDTLRRILGYSEESNRCVLC